MGNTLQPGLVITCVYVKRPICYSKVTSYHWHIGIAVNGSTISAARSYGHHTILQQILVEPLIAMISSLSRNAFIRKWTVTVHIVFVNSLLFKIRVGLPIFAHPGAILCLVFITRWFFGRCCPAGPTATDPNGFIRPA